MKKNNLLLMIILCLFLTGCSNTFAKSEYNLDAKIAEMQDHYAKEWSVFNPIDGGYILKVAKFNGRETLWKKELKDAQSVEVSVSLTLTGGQVKIVHIDADDNVTTLVECIPETASDTYVSKVISMTEGCNRIKIVGYDCEDVELKLLFTLEE